MEVTTTGARGCSRAGGADPKDVFPELPNWANLQHKGPPAAFQPHGRRSGFAGSGLELELDISMFRVCRAPNADARHPGGLPTLPSITARPTLPHLPAPYHAPVVPVEGIMHRSDTPSAHSFCTTQVSLHAHTTTIACSLSANEQGPREHLSCRSNWPLNLDSFL